MCDANVLLTPQQETETIGMGKARKSQTAFERFQKVALFEVIWRIGPMCDANVLLTPQQETETIGMGKSYVR